MEAVKTLDCKRKACPEPIMEIKNAMGQLKSGEVVRMLATDAGSVNDMASWSRRTGNPILEQNSENGVYIFFVQKK